METKDKIGIALVHEVCPICGRPMNEQILMNSKLSVKLAKELNEANGKAIGISKDAYDECSKYKNKGIFIIEIDAEKSHTIDNKVYPRQIYRTGRIACLNKDFELFKDAKDFIITTANGVQYLYMDEIAYAKLGLDKSK